MKKVRLIIVIVVVLSLVLFITLELKRRHEMYALFKKSSRVLIYADVLTEYIETYDRLPTTDTLVYLVKSNYKDNMNATDEQIEEYFYNLKYGIGIKTDSTLRNHYVYSFGPDYKDDKLEKMLLYTVDKDGEFQTEDISFWNFTFGKGDIILIKMHFD